MNTEFDDWQGRSPEKLNLSYKACFYCLIGIVIVSILAMILK
jgi:hypothetical protein